MQVNIKIPNNIPEEDKKKLKELIEGDVMGEIEPRRSGCMLILILPLIFSLTIIF